MCVRILGLGSDHVNFLEMLEDAQLFFKEIETCGFSLEQPSNYMMVYMITKWILYFL